MSSQIDSSIVLLVVETTHCTRLVYIVKCHIVGGLLCTASHIEVVCLNHSRTEHVVLPVETWILVATCIVAVSLNYVRIIQSA